jgi:hypothetical protein
VPVNRRGMIAGTGAAVAATAAGTGTAAAAAAARRVAQPPEYRTAIEVIGALVQDGLKLTGYGWVTHIDGLADASLFTDPSVRQEGSARLTWYAEADVTGRSVLGEVFSVSANGEVRFVYRSSGGARLDAPDSFAAGRLVARHSARLRTVLTVIAPDHAVVDITGELRQVETRAFTLGGASRRLGRNGLRQRFSAAGLGIRTDAVAPRATFHVAGGLVVPG